MRFRLREAGVGNSSPTPVFFVTVWLYNMFRNRGTDLMAKDKEKSAKFWNGVIGTILIFIFIILIAQIPLLPVLAILRVVKVSPLWYSLLTNYLSVALFGLVFVIYMARKDKESLETMRGRYGKNNLKSLLLGLLVGLVTNGGLALIAYACGNINLEFKGMNFFLAIISLVFVAAQCTAEEIAQRVFLYQRFKRRKGVVFAIIMNAVIFAALHIPNLISYKIEPLYAAFAMVNIMLVGIFLALTVHYFENVWFAFAFHSAWNYCQNFIFGLPNSGNPATDCIWGLTDEGTDSLIYSTKFGVEATICASIVLVILIVGTILLGRKKVNGEGGHED